jgi:hypothetical protein
VQRVMAAGPEYLDQLSAADRAGVTAQLDRAFRIVFFSIAAITSVGVLVATTVPQPKL